jgi:hypothetical protein
MEDGSYAFGNSSLIEVKVSRVSKTYPGAGISQSSGRDLCS